MAEPSLLGRIEDALEDQRAFWRSWFPPMCERCRMTRADARYANCACDFALENSPVHFERVSPDRLHASNGWTITRTRDAAGAEIWVASAADGRAVPRRTKIQAKEFIRSLAEDRIEMPVGEDYPFGPKAGAHDDKPSAPGS